MKILADFHHSDLLKSLDLLFSARLGHELFRPIGMEWFEEGFWNVHPHPETAKQFLSLEQTYNPVDGTPTLNKVNDGSNGVYSVEYPGGELLHQACTLQYFKENSFDLLICSIPQHIPLYEKLIQLYQPQAKLIYQVGNHDFNFSNMAGKNVLASVAPRKVASSVNAIFYHQEIDPAHFYPAPTLPTNKFYSFVNVIQEQGDAWEQFLELERLTAYFGAEWKAFGGGCRDGCAQGNRELGDKMRESMFVVQLKPQGDGFGHVMHDAYSVGRPVITRSSYYRGKLAGELLVPGTFIDLDKHSMPDVKNILHRLYSLPESLLEMGNKARARFEELVDYPREADQISEWLNNLI